jgi:hypothetical protein
MSLESFVYTANVALRRVWMLLNGLSKGRSPLSFGTGEVEFTPRASWSLQSTAGCSGSMSRRTRKTSSLLAAIDGSPRLSTAQTFALSEIVASACCAPIRRLDALRDHRVGTRSPEAKQGGSSPSARSASPAPKLRFGGCWSTNSIEIVDPEASWSVVFRARARRTRFRPLLAAHRSRTSAATIKRRALSTALFATAGGRPE